MTKRLAETSTGVPVHKVQVVELFDSLPTETSIQDGYWQEYRPTQATFHPTQFLIPPVTNFIDLSQCYLELGLKLVKANGSDVDATDINVGTVNNIAHSMIKRFDVKLNNTSTGEPTDLYHMKAYVQNLLNFTPEQKDSYLAQEGWYTDKAGKLDVHQTVTSDGLDNPLPSTHTQFNPGYLERTSLFFTNFERQVKWDAKLFSVYNQLWTFFNRDDFSFLKSAWIFRSTTTSPLWWSWLQQEEQPR